VAAFNICIGPGYIAGRLFWGWVRLAQFGMQLNLG
jgi:hypothetical protein